MFIVGLSNTNNIILTLFGLFWLQSVRSFSNIIYLFSYQTIWNSPSIKCLIIGCIFLLNFCIWLRKYISHMYRINLDENFFLKTMTNLHSFLCYCLGFFFNLLLYLLYCLYSSYNTRLKNLWYFFIFLISFWISFFFFFFTIIFLRLSIYCFTFQITFSSIFMYSIFNKIIYI